MTWGVLHHSRQKREASPSLPTSSVTRGWPPLSWRSDGGTRKVCGHVAPPAARWPPCRPLMAEKPERVAGRPSWEADPPAGPGGGCAASGGGAQLSGYRLGVQGSPAGAPGDPPALLLRTRSFPEWLCRASREPELGGLRPVSLCPPRACTKPARLDPRGHADRQACCPGPSRSCSAPPLCSELHVPSTSPSAPRTGWLVQGWTSTQPDPWAQGRVLVTAVAARLALWPVRCSHPRLGDG